MALSYPNMINDNKTLTLVDSATGHLALKLLFFNDCTYFDHLQRHNYYSLVWMKKGNGTAKVELSETQFTDNTLYSLSLYQPYMFESKEPVSGVALFFHPDFFCIIKHQAEVACNGVLFNNIYQPPFITLDEKSATQLEDLVTQMREEMEVATLAQSELLVAYLKVFLILASRIKVAQTPELNDSYKVTTTSTQVLSQNLREAIEVNYRTKHSPSEYADLLNISPKALAKATKKQFDKTLSELINERIIIEAKRELYLTNKSVKEISHELGYEDPYYFSRFFKTFTDVSPQVFRETIGAGRGVALS